MDDTAIETWRSLVEAEGEVAKCRAAVSRLPARAELLTKAVSDGSPWERATGLNFLRIFPGAVPKMLELLLDLSLSAGWARPVGDALHAARRHIDPSRLAEIVDDVLSDDDADNYLRIAVMLAELEAWDVLGALIQRASDSGDPELVEVAEDLRVERGAV